MSGDRLERYRDIRDFEATPEPAGEVSPEPDGRPRFVVQQHDATALHWDLRLEHDGVLVSWAVPRGIPWSPDENHLAVHTEDHPMEYLDFEGDIPEGNYGAGHMDVWDHGTYEPVEFQERKVQVVLHGQRVEGRYALFATGKDGRNWMIHRMDPPQDPDRQPLPSNLPLMWPTPGKLPDDPEETWGYEIRWSGARVLVASSGGRIRVSDADGNDVTDHLPELRRLGRQLGYTEAILDGVVVAKGPGGRPLPDRAQVDRRFAQKSESTIRRLSETAPLAVMLFDLLWQDGYPVLDVPYAQRRDRLELLGLEGPGWQTPSIRWDSADALLTAVQDQGFPGLVAKRADSLYHPGEKSADWVEVTKP
jgi:bifunctional non-homologous end joining protein LigD